MGAFVFRPIVLLPAFQPQSGVIFCCVVFFRRRLYADISSRNLEVCGPPPGLYCLFRRRIYGVWTHYYFVFQSSLTPVYVRMSFFMSEMTGCSCWVFRTVSTGKWGVRAPYYFGGIQCFAAPTLLLQAFFFYGFLLLLLGSYDNFPKYD